MKQWLVHMQIFLQAYIMVQEMTGAKGFGDRHEEYPENPSYERKMVLNNNNVGRLIAQQLIGKNKNTLSAECKQAFTYGRFLLLKLFFIF